MKSPGAIKQVFFVFVLALIIYFGAFYFIEHHRTHNGPWEVTFTNESAIPALLIRQSKLNISDVRINFPGAPALSTNDVLIFEQPQPTPFDVPFGQCIFEDLTFKPGTVVFKILGHEIQLLPRVLTIDKTEYPGNPIALIRSRSPN